MENFFPLACTNANANPLLVDDDGYLRDGWAQLDELAGRARVPLDLFDFGSTGDADSTPALTAGSIAASTPPGEVDEDSDVHEQDEQRSDASLADEEEDVSDDDWPEVRDNDEPEISHAESDQDARGFTPPQVVDESPSADTRASRASSILAPSVGLSAQTVEQSVRPEQASGSSTNAPRGRKRRADQDQDDALTDAQGAKRQRVAQMAPGAPYFAPSNAPASRVAPLPGMAPAADLGIPFDPAVGMPMLPVGYADNVGNLQPRASEDAAVLQPAPVAQCQESQETVCSVSGHRLTLQLQSSTAPGNGQPAQKHNNNRTRPYRAYEALRRAHADALIAEARRILELPEDTPASALPAPKTLTEALKDELRGIGPGTTGRVISNTAGYIVCAICKEDFDLDRELVINEDWAIERHIKEYHSDAACSACGMPVAARDVKAFRRHRAVCPVWYALVKSGWHWAWMVEHGLVRADVDEMNAEFFVKREKDAARRADDTLGCLEEIMKGGEIAELTNILDKFLKRLGLDGVQRAVAKQETADGGAVAGPSRQANSGPV